MKLPTLVSCLALAAVSTFPQGEVERSAIQLTVHAPAGAAFERTMAAFVQAGLLAPDGNAAAGTVTSLPVERQRGMVHLEITYRARIVPTADSSALVVLSGTYAVRDPAGQLSAEPQPITSHPHGAVAHAQAWDVIEQIARALEAK
jgi:hypothetical protein